MEWYPHTQYLRSVEEEGERQELICLGSLTKHSQTFYDGDPGYENFTALVLKGWATVEAAGLGRKYSITNEGRELYRSRLLADLGVQIENARQRLAEREEFARLVANGSLF